MELKNKIDSFKENFQKDFLNLEITLCISKLKQLKNEQNQIMDFLINT